jgi:hypothetical protein
MLAHSKDMPAHDFLLMWSIIAALEAFWLVITPNSHA